MLKEGKLRKYNKDRFLGTKWPEVFCVLESDSTFNFYDKKGDHSPKGSLKLADLAPYIAIGPYTKVVPNRPSLPSGATEYHLLAVGTGPSGFVHWFLFLNDDELNDWMNKIASTLPKASPQQQATTPAPAPQQSQGSSPSYPQPQNPPPSYPQPQNPSSYYPSSPPQQQYGGQGAMYPNLPQPVAYGSPSPGYAPPPSQPYPAYYPQQPAPAPTTTVIIKDRPVPAYGTGSGFGGGSGLGTMGGVATGMLVGGALGYGLGSITHPFGGWGCGSGWGGSWHSGPGWGYGGGGGGYGGGGFGSSYQDNDTTIINNYNITDDSRTTTNDIIVHNFSNKPEGSTGCKETFSKQP
uniref:PH domain-containing protein n=1 Tax=Romanomermis culicivorax TaxID=13658 RepID=A0A915I427_ROMCU